MAVGGLFVEVGMMLVEGRMSPAGSGSGSGVHPSVTGSSAGCSSAVPPVRPGPHVSLQSAVSSSHVCNQSNHLCVKAEGLRRHMFLLSESRVPMCIDVYLCAECACGRARAAASQPASSDLLLEQWTVAFTKCGQGMEVDGKGLLAAIRSQLHFSQLSAWYSRHGASAVPPVCYRLGHPAPAPPAQSMFHRPPVDHVFPTVRVNSNLFLKVSMKCLPRLDCIPEVACPVHGCRRTLSSVNTVIDRNLSSPSPCQPPVKASSNHSPPSGVSLSSPCVGGSSLSEKLHKDTGGASTGCTHQAKASPATPSQAALTAFRTVFAELGHCLLDPPSRIPPLKQGFLAWRERRSHPASPPHSQHTVPQHNSLSSPAKASSIGMVDDRMQCGCKHIGKHHCEEPLDTDHITETQSHTQFYQQHNRLNQIDSGCHSKETRKSSGSPPRSHHVHTIRPINSISPPSTNHCGSCREKELNKANALHCGTPLGGVHSHTDCLPTNRNTSAPLIILTPATQPNPLKRKRQQEGTNSKKLSAARPDDDQLPFNSQQLVDIFRKLDIRSPDHPTINTQKICKEVEGRSISSSLASSPTANSPLTTPSSLATSPLTTPSSLATSPLLSSPSPNKKCGWTDSSSEDTESESPSKVCSNLITPSRNQAHHRTKFSAPHCARYPVVSSRSKNRGPLLGSLEECLLKGRLRPDRVISEGYTADLGASGAFCPKHLSLPVSVELYPPVGLASPLLGSTSVGKKGYSVPRCGTIQATLLNPHGTVVKMFVVPYDLEDMPSNTTTFLRQRITSVSHLGTSPLLRYLIHLRFSSSKSGRIYLDGDIWMVVCRQYDADATLGLDPLESNTHLSAVLLAPDNPKYSPRK